MAGTERIRRVANIVRKQQAAGHEVAVVIDAGPAKLGKASTVLRLEPELEILRAGDLSLKDLQKA